MSQGRSWDAEAYDKLSTPQQRWGRAVLADVELQGDETVIDAGCGTGKLTAQLAERLPRGKVIALDASEAMLEVARRELAPFGGRVELLQADLGALRLDGVADLVFSTATFHWVLDHDALFSGLHRALRPHGRLVAQCGGLGNLERVLRRADAFLAARWPERLEGWKRPSHYASAEESAERLRRAGFDEAKAWLAPEPTPFPDAKSFREFCKKVVLDPHLARCPDDPAREALLDAVTAQAAADAAPFTLDYVRLNLRARRP